MISGRAWSARVVRPPPHGGGRIHIDRGIRFVGRSDIRTNPAVHRIQTNPPCIASKRTRPASHPNEPALHRIQTNPALGRRGLWPCECGKLRASERTQPRARPNEPGRGRSHAVATRTSDPRTHRRTWAAYRQTNPGDWPPIRARAAVFTESKRTQRMDTPGQSRFARARSSERTPARGLTARRLRPTLEAF
jgi:hypothetical protein